MDFSSCSVCPCPVTLPVFPSGAFFEVLPHAQPGQAVILAGGGIWHGKGAPRGREEHGASADGPVPAFILRRLTGRERQVGSNAPVEKNVFNGTSLL